MKKLFKIKLAYLAAFLLMGVFSSCESFLKEESISDLSLDQITDFTTLNAAKMGVYSRLQGCYVSSTIPIGELGTDITSTNKSSNATVMAVDQYQCIPSSTAPTQYWKRHYLVIRDALVVLDKAEELYANHAITEDNYNSVTAEVKFLRAWAYFKLMEAFGEVPIIDTCLKDITDEIFAYGRSSITDVFHYIENDLNEAIASGGLGEKRGGTVNKWAAMSLLAKLYLYVGTSKQRNVVGTPDGAFRADDFTVPIPGGKTDIIPGYSAVPEDYMDLYQKCHDLTDSIIVKGGFSLLDDYRKVFMSKYKNSEECIWDIQYAAIDGYGSDWSKNFGILTGNNQFQFSAVGGRLVMGPTPSFWKYFKQGDVRRDIIISHNKIEYADDYSIAFIQDFFTNSEKVKFLNPGSGVMVDVIYHGGMDWEDPTYLRYASRTSPMKNLGSWKYAWGEGDDPEAWKAQQMSYSMDNCPNNVIVFRLPDIIMMFAEADMLLNGASPAAPSEAHASQLAVDRVNLIVERAMAGKTHEQLCDELLQTLKAEYVTDSTNMETHYANWVGKPTNNTYYSNYMQYKLMADDLEYRINHIDDIVIKPYTTATLTYERLIDERACELWGEFQRWFDLQRLGWLEYKVYRIMREYGTFPLPNIVVPKHYLYPIPLDDTDLSTNPGFSKNNPGYVGE